MAAHEYVLGPQERIIVDATIREVCRFKGVDVLALNVRTNHVHLVAGGDFDADRLAAALKAWCTRRLRETGLVSEAAIVWAEGASTGPLWREAELATTCDYVLHRQGAPLVPRTDRELSERGGCVPSE